ncbi:Hsp70 family protein [bacterium]|nr:Hsp70 family protein [bacterium]
MPNQRTDKQLAATVSIAVMNDATARFFAEGTELPAKIHRMFGPTDEGSAAIEIHLVQGESSLASENTSIGKWRISGFPSGPEQDDQCAEVVFVIDQEGILTIQSKPVGKLDVRLLTEEIPKVELR